MQDEKDITRGVLYFAQGEKYLIEAINSAKSLKRQNKNIYICLKTPDRNFSSSVFDRVDYIEPLQHPYQTKIKAIIESPFERTLFLDTDTKIVKPIVEIFDFLYTYDMGLTFLPLCFWPANSPAIFRDFIDPTQYNTGVIIYQKNDRVIKFLNLWLKIATSHEMGLIDGFDHGDQTDFNKLVFNYNEHMKLGLNIVNLPNTKYNARPWIWKELKKRNQFNEIKILHAHNLFDPFWKLLFSKLRHKFLN